MTVGGGGGEEAPGRPSEKQIKPLSPILLAAANEHACVLALT